MFSKIVIDRYRPREHVQQCLCWAYKESIFSGSEKFQKKEFQPSAPLSLDAKAVQNAMLEFARVELGFKPSQGDIHCWSVSKGTVNSGPLTVRHVG